MIHLTLSICSAGNYNQCRIQGKSPGDPLPPPPRRLFLDQTDARRVEKIFFRDRIPLLPLYLKN